MAAIRRRTISTFGQLFGGLSGSRAAVVFPAPPTISFFVEVTDAISFEVGATDAASFEVEVADEASFDVSVTG